jgi:hypothetical protein
MRIICNLEIRSVSRCHRPPAELVIAVIAGVLSSSRAFAHEAPPRGEDDAAGAPAAESIPEEERDAANPDATDRPADWMFQRFRVR